MWPIVRLVVLVALALVAVNLVAGRRDELEGAGAILADIRWEWVVLATIIELTSVVAFAEVERRMLGAGGLRMGLWPLSGIALAGNSIQNSLPGGVAWASVFAYRQFPLPGGRRRAGRLDHGGCGNPLGCVPGHPRRCRSGPGR